MPKEIVHLSAPEIVRRLRVIRYSPAEPRMFKRALGLRPIAREAGLSHMTVYRAIMSGEISDKSAALLSPVLVRVTNQHVGESAFA
jgi:hypothetical protein